VTPLTVNDANKGEGSSEVIISLEQIF